MVQLTASKFAIQLVAIVQAQVTTYKHFKGFHLHIEFTGTGCADAVPRWMYCYFSKYFRIYLRKFNFTLLLIEQDICNGFHRVCASQSIYSYNVKKVKGI